MRRRILVLAAATAAIGLVSSTGVAAAAASPKPGTAAAGPASAALPFNTRTQLAADRIVNADEAALSGKRVSALRPLSRQYDTTIAGIAITAHGLQVSVAGHLSAVLAQAIRTEADGVPVTVKVVAHSQTQLEAVQARIGKDAAYWREHGVILSAWGPDLSSDKVLVSLAHYSARAAAAITVRYGSRWVQVSTASLVAQPSTGSLVAEPSQCCSRTDDTTPWWGGDELLHVSGDTIWVCTTGFGVEIDGVTYVTTAFHCAESNYSNSFYNPGGTIGYLWGAYDAHDTMLIQASTAGVIWSNPTSVDRLVVGVDSTDPVGGLICTDGLSDLEVCDVEIDATNQSITYTINGSSETVVNTVYACQKSGKAAFSPGDSGAPVETTLGSLKTDARGLLLAHVVGDDACGWYLPERYVESDWDATVLTS
jgi:hypothetical protein